MPTRILICLLFASSTFAQVRINCGGGAMTDASGTWLADNSFSGGTSSSGSATEPYGTVRFSALPFNYTIVTAPGKYTLNLIFQEEFVSGPGLRIFNVAVNGQPFLTNFDIFATAGPARYVATLPVTSTGLIQISFTTVFRSAIINAIEILPVVAVPPQALSMVKESWLFVPTAAIPSGTNATVAFKLTFNPDPSSLIEAYRNGVLQFSRWDYTLLLTSPPTVQMVIPVGPSHVQQIATIRYWTTESPAVEILH